MMRTAVLAAILCLLSAGAMAQQTCTTRADGSFNCTTATAATTPPPAPTIAPSVRDHRSFQPDDTGLLRIPTLEGEILFHCDSAGPCREIGANPMPLNR
jgi:hypothetical protein